jgi:hypothetical protein
MYILLTTKLPFGGNDIITVLENSKSMVVKYPDYMARGAVKLLKKIFVKYQQRITIKQFLDDPWMST